MTLIYACKQCFGIILPRIQFFLKKHHSHFLVTSLSHKTPKFILFLFHFRVQWPKVARTKILVKFTILDTNSRGNYISGNFKRTMFQSLKFFLKIDLNVFFCYFSLNCFLGFLMHCLLVPSHCISLRRNIRFSRIVDNKVTWLAFPQL